MIGQLLSKLSLGSSSLMQSGRSAGYSVPHPRLCDGFSRCFCFVPLPLQVPFEVLTLGFLRAILLRRGYAFPRCRIHTLNGPLPSATVRRRYGIIDWGACMVLWRADVPCRCTSLPFPILMETRDNQSSPSDIDIEASLSGQEEAVAFLCIPRIQAFLR